MPTIMKVRRQGGAHIVTIPPALLERMGASAGTALSLRVRDGALIARPIEEPVPTGRRRYTLDELLEGAEYLPEVYRGVRSALDGDPAGNEIG